MSSHRPGNGSNQSIFANDLFDDSVILRLNTKNFFTAQDRMSGADSGEVDLHDRYRYLFLQQTLDTLETLRQHTQDLCNKKHSDITQKEALLGIRLYPEQIESCSDRKVRNTLRLELIEKEDEIEELNNTLEELKEQENDFIKQIKYFREKEQLFLQETLRNYGPNGLEFLSNTAYSQRDKGLIYPYWWQDTQILAKLLNQRTSSPITDTILSRTKFKLREQYQKISFRKKDAFSDFNHARKLQLQNKTTEQISDNNAGGNANANANANSQPQERLKKITSDYIYNSLNTFLLQWKERLKSRGIAELENEQQEKLEKAIVQSLMESLVKDYTAPTVSSQSDEVVEVGAANDDLETKITKAVGSQVQHAFSHLSNHSELSAVLALASEENFEEEFTQNIPDIMRSLFKVENLDGFNISSHINDSLKTKLEESNKNNKVLSLGVVVSILIMIIAAIMVSLFLTGIITPDFNLNESVSDGSDSLSDVSESSYQESGNDYSFINEHQNEVIDHYNDIQANQHELSSININSDASYSLKDITNSIESAELSDSGSLQGASITNSEGQVVAYLDQVEIPDSGVDSGSDLNMYEVVQNNRGDVAEVLVVGDSGREVSLFDRSNMLSSSDSGVLSGEHYSAETGEIVRTEVETIKNQADNMVSFTRGSEISDNIPQTDDVTTPNSGGAFSSLFTKEAELASISAGVGGLALMTLTALGTAGREMYRRGKFKFGSEESEIFNNKVTYSKGMNKHDKTRHLYSELEKLANQSLLFDSQIGYLDQLQKQVSLYKESYSDNLNRKNISDILANLSEKLASNINSQKKEIDEHKSERHNPNRKKQNDKLNSCNRIQESMEGLIHYFNSILLTNSLRPSSDLPKTQEQPKRTTLPTQSDTTYQETPSSTYSPYLTINTRTLRPIFANDRRSTVSSQDSSQATSEPGA